MKKIFSLIIGFILFFVFSASYASTWEVEKNSYTYYYGQWCSHCASIDKYMEWISWMEKIDISKNEIYFDDDNRKEYLAAWERLWISESDLWIPFLVINNNWEENYIIWDQPILKYFKWFLWEAPENPNKTIILIIIWLLVVLIPVFLIKSSK